MPDYKSEYWALALILSLRINLLWVSLPIWSISLILLLLLLLLLSLSLLLRLWPLFILPIRLLRATLLVWPSTLLIWPGTFLLCLPLLLLLLLICPITLILIWILPSSPCSLISLILPCTLIWLSILLRGWTSPTPFRLCFNLRIIIWLSYTNIQTNLSTKISNRATYLRKRWCKI